MEREPIADIWSYELARESKQSGRPVVLDLEFYKGDRKNPRFRDLFQRHSDNPIITVEDAPYPANTVLNAVVTKTGNETLLFMQVDGCSKRQWDQPPAHQQSTAFDAQSGNLS